MTPFPMIEMALKELIEGKYEPAEGRVGGDLSHTPGSGLYVWISLLPVGAATETDGTFVLDIDCFDDSYAAAMTHALALEPVLLARRHVTSVMRLDQTTQNTGPAERPWDDDNSFRVGATYVFTARRQG